MKNLLKFFEQRYIRDLIINRYKENKMPEVKDIYIVIIDKSKPEQHYNKAIKFLVEERNKTRIVDEPKNIHQTLHK